MAYQIVEAEENVMTKKIESDLLKKYCFYAEIKNTNKKRIKSMKFNQFLMMCVDEAIFKKDKILGKKTIHYYY